MTPSSMPPGRYPDEENPTLKAIMQTHKEMAAALARAAPAAAAGATAAGATERRVLKRRLGSRASRSEQLQRQHITASSANAMYDAGMQRLRALMSQFERHMYEPLAQMLVHMQPNGARLIAPAQPDGQPPAGQHVAAAAAAPMAAAAAQAEDVALPPGGSSLVAG